jgi:hypothetical protein
MIMNFFESYFYPSLGFGKYERIVCKLGIATMNYCVWNQLIQGAILDRGLISGINIRLQIP